ncbi:hypothetical protein [Cedecea sp.]|jgi:hypothetical protein|uniref:hypothetical protein n=1 Tax=Cedecea sp. TaxID=1970739 RepID=UPI002F3FDAC1
MTEEQIDSLVQQILQRLRPPVLVLVTHAEGYRHEIRHRLAECGHPLTLALEDGISDAGLWQTAGKTLLPSEWQHTLPKGQWRALVLPFLDYSLAAELVNGTLQSPIARRLHDALLIGLPVLALRYHCDPNSELNQLRGARAQSAYGAHIQATLAKVAEIGVALCTMNELLERLGSDVAAAAKADGSRRYLTVTDIMNNPALASAPNAQLTDAAVDFLKTEKRTLP